LRVLGRENILRKEDCLSEGFSGAVHKGPLPLARWKASRPDQGRKASWAVRVAAVHRRSALTTGLAIHTHNYREG
jgi:hypothetical protein